MKKSMMNGFTLIEALFSLAMTVLLTGLVNAYLYSAVCLYHLAEDHQDQLAILQLRERLAVSKHIEVQQRSLFYVKQNQKFIVEWDKQRLVKRPGYEILMEGIKDAQFVLQEDKIYLVWKKGKRTYQAQIL